MNARDDDRGEFQLVPGAAGCRDVTVTDDASSNRSYCVAGKAAE